MVNARSRHIPTPHIREEHRITSIAAAGSSLPGVRSQTDFPPGEALTMRHEKAKEPAAAWR